jgi:hypothetical protein
LGNIEKNNCGRTHIQKCCAYFFVLARLFLVSRVIVVTKLYATMHFYDVQRYRKLIKVEGLFLVKLTRIAIQDSKVVVPSGVSRL